MNSHLTGNPAPTGLPLHGKKQWEEQVLDAQAFIKLHWQSMDNVSKFFAILISAAIIIGGAIAGLTLVVTSMLIVLALSLKNGLGNMIQQFS